MERNGGGHVVGVGKGGSNEALRLGLYGGITKDWRDHTVGLLPEVGREEVEVTGRLESSSTVGFGDDERTAVGGASGWLIRGIL